RTHRPEAPSSPPSRARGRAGRTDDAIAPPARSSRRLPPTSSFSDRLRPLNLPLSQSGHLVRVLDIRTHSIKFGPRARFRRITAVVVKTRGGSHDERAGCDAVCARDRKRVPQAGVVTPE